MLIGQDPGGCTDLIARAVAERLARTSASPSRWSTGPARTARWPTEEVAGKPADGQSSWCMLTASLITITPLAVSADEAVDLDDLDVVTGISQDDYVLVANADTGFKTIAGPRGAPVARSTSAPPAWAPAASSLSGCCSRRPA